MKSRFYLLCAFAMCCLLQGEEARAGTLTQFDEEAAFLSAAGPGLVWINFESFPEMTVLTDQIPGVFFWSPNEALGETWYEPITVVSPVATASPPKGIMGGAVYGSYPPPQITAMDFDPPTLAVSFWFTESISGGTDAQVHIEFIDGSSTDLSIPATPGLVHEFFGVISSDPIARVITTSGVSQGEFVGYVLDDFRFKMGSVPNEIGTWSQLRARYR